MKVYNNTLNLSTLKDSGHHLKTREEGGCGFQSLDTAIVPWPLPKHTECAHTHFLQDPILISYTEGCNLQKSLHTSKDVFGRI